VKQTNKQQQNTRLILNSVTYSGDHLEDLGQWEDNIKMDVNEIKTEGMDCIYLAQDRNSWQAVVNTVMNLRIP
jgi:hypothetical protein